jgi:hypothetical protein
MKTKQNTGPQFNHAGFVTSNPRKGARKGAIYLCWNNCATRIMCCGCWTPNRAGAPLAFFFEGDAGTPACERCALDRGFTIAPDAWARLKGLVTAGFEAGRATGRGPKKAKRWKFATING